MAFDEVLFGRLHRWWKQRRQARDAARELDLEAMAARWTRLAMLVSGHAVAVSFGPEPGRLGQTLSLPRVLPRVGEAGDAEAVALLRLAVGAAAEANAVDAAETTMAAALPRLLDWLDHHWPSARALRPAAIRYAGLLTPARITDEAELLTSVLGPLPHASTALPPPAVGADRAALPRGTERRKRRRSTVEIIEVEAKDDGGNPLAHVFEKVRTAEEHTGGNRAMDGSDELDQHLEALDELDLRRVVRSRSASASVFAADVDFAASFADLESTSQEPARFCYDEWDGRSRRYLKDWCAVTERAGDLGAIDATARWVRSVRAKHGSTVARLRAEFARLMRGPKLCNRQLVGAEIDLCAVVERHGDLQAARAGRGVVGEGRLYVARRPMVRDLAVLLLLDRSLSSDAWVAGRRVLDTTREAVLVLGEALDGVRLPIAMGAFCSHTHADCRYDVLATFDEGWPIARRRLFDLQPDGYTRIGPALRHGTFLLRQQPARRRLLLVLSDCKPVDYDHYEGRRGIGDVRQAVREARRSGVETLALAIDRSASMHLPQMFGRNGFRVLADAAQLAAAMARLHERWLRS